MDLFAHRISRSPVISCPRTLFMHVKVLRIVDILVRARLYAIYHSGFQVQEDCTRDISSIVGLIEEDIFPVSAFCREVLKIAILVYTVFAAELLPELASNCARAISTVQMTFDVASISSCRVSARVGWIMEDVLTAIAALACLNGYYFSVRVLALSLRSRDW